MPLRIKQGFGRIIATRERMLEVRNARFETLQRLRNFAKARLAEFVSTTDPVTGQRLADVSVGGDKARGEMAMVVSFFEGTKLRVDVDVCAQYKIEATPPELFAEVGRMIELIVPMDLSRAEIVFEPAAGPKGAHQKLDVVDVLAKMIEYAAANVEDELGEAGIPLVATPPRPAAVAPGVAAPAKPVFSFSIG